MVTDRHDPGAAADWLASGMTQAAYADNTASTTKLSGISVGSSLLTPSHRLTDRSTSPSMTLPS